MKPTKLYYENFQALNGEHELKPVTMFTGLNETGKTTNLRAAVVALLGYWPAVGKQAGPTMKFAGGNKNEMLVHLDFDDGTHITRKFTRNATTGDVSRTVDGSVPAIPEVLFTASSYLEDTTAAQRVKMVFERVDIKDLMFSDEHLLDRLTKIEVLPVDLLPDARVDCLNVVRKTMERRGKLKQSPQTWLDELVKDLENTRKGEDDLQKQASAQLQVLRPAGGKIPTEPDANVVKEANAKLEAARNAKAELDTKRTQFTQTGARREKLTKLLEAAIPDISQLQGKKANLEQKIKEHSSSTAECKSKVDNIRGEYRRISELIKAQKLELTTLNKALKDLETQKQCPYCRSSRKDWKTEYAEDLTAKITELGSALAGNETILGTLEDDGKKANADVAAAETADKRIGALATELIEINNQIVLANRDATERAGAEGELKALQGLANPTDDEILAATNAITSANAAVIELNNQKVLFDAYKGQKAQREDTEKKLLRHQIRVAIYKQALAIVIEEQKKIVSQAFDSILAPARRFTDRLITGKLDYQNDELGAWQDAGWVSHDVLSGRSQSLAYLGLQVALARQSPIKLVLIDEFGKFDVPTKIRVLERLCALTDEGFIDCALCTDARSDDYSKFQNSQFQLIECGV